MVLSFVGPVRIGWWIDVIVIEKRIVERRRKEGQERVYIGRMRTVLGGVRRIVPCTNLNMGILKGHVIHEQTR